MQNVKAILISNTAVDTVEEFKEAQKEMNNPMVIFMDKKTNECIDHFKIVAEDYKELRLMFDSKIFYTSSIPDGETKRMHGAIFHGVDKHLWSKQKTVS